MFVLFIPPHLSVDHGRSIHYKSRCWPVVINQFLHLHPRTGSTVSKLSPIMPTPRLISRWVVWSYTNGVAVWGSGLHSCVYSSWSEIRYPANIDIFDPQIFGIFFFNLFPWWELSWLIRTISFFFVLFVCFVTGRWMPPHKPCNLSWESYIPTLAGNLLQEQRQNKRKHEEKSAW